MKLELFLLWIVKDIIDSYSISLLLHKLDYWKMVEWYANDYFDFSIKVLDYIQYRLYYKELNLSNHSKKKVIYLRSSFNQNFYNLSLFYVFIDMKSEI